MSWPCCSDAIAQQDQDTHESNEEQEAEEDDESHEACNDEEEARWSTSDQEAREVRQLDQWMDDGY